MNRILRLFSVCVPLSMLCASSALAVPAKPVKKSFVRSDGQSVELTLTGDEYLHFYRTPEGKAMRLTADNVVEEIPSDELERMKGKALAMRQQTEQALGLQRAPQRDRQTRSAGVYVGKKRGLVLLVSFSNLDMTIANPREEFTALFNQQGYSKDGMAGSVKDYFLAQSYGQLDIDFDVVGPYKLNKPLSYYGGNYENGHDLHVQEMAKEAMLMADADVNYSHYDWNGDGEVDQVFIVFAGYAESQGADANTIWPHASYVSDLTLEGKRLGRYACSSELKGTDGTVIGGIGTPCHEFSHCLGLMDVYDVNYTNNYSTDWDIMAGGSYNGSERVPCGFTAYERWVSGWLEPVELTSPQTVEGMKALTDAPEAYVLYNDGNRNEYFMLENRQQTGYDTYLPGHGLLITHVDYDEDAWKANGLNVNSSHMRMVIVPADGDINPYQQRGDAFPGPNGATAWTDYTTPSATLYNKNTDGSYLLHKPIEAIAESEDGLISFMALYPILRMGEIQCNREAASLTYSWDAVEGAEYYNILLNEFQSRREAAQSCILLEDFSKCYRSSVGFSDISGKLNQYLDNKGFTGTALYQSPSLLRMGTTTSNGAIATPAMDEPSTGQLTARCVVEPVTEGKEVTVEVYLMESKQYYLAADTFTITERETLTSCFENMLTDQTFFVMIKCKGRANMSHLSLYDGVFSAEELDAAGDVAQGELVKKTPCVETSVSTCRYEVPGYNSGCRYKLRVCPMTQVRTGLWSLWKESLPDPTPVLPVFPDAQPSFSGRWYDLQGRPIDVPRRRGIYIVDGKKVVK
ncbi:MAG: M6 family metalloprotease domain-containing protein [Bacteroidaceae bacterium]